jgi:hypothetical protein
VRRTLFGERCAELRNATISWSMGVLSQADLSPSSLPALPSLTACCSQLPRVHCKERELREQNALNR